MEDQKRIQVTIELGLWKRLSNEATDAGITLPELVKAKLAGPVQRPKPGGVVESKASPAKAAPAPEQRRVQHSAYTS